MRAVLIGAARTAAQTTAQAAELPGRASFRKESGAQGIPPPSRVLGSPCVTSPLTDRSQAVGREPGTTKSIPPPPRRTHAAPGEPALTTRCRPGRPNLGIAPSRLESPSRSRS